MPDDSLKGLLAALEEMFQPLLDAAANPSVLFGLLNRTGWTLRGAVADPAALSASIGAIRAAIDAVRAIAESEDVDFEALKEALSATSRIPGAVEQLVNALAQLAPSAQAALAQLPVDLLELLFIDWFQAKSPLAYAICRAAGLIVLEQTTEIRDATDRPLREEVLLARLKFERLPDWLTDPSGQMRLRFGMAAVTDEAAAGEYALRVFPLLALLAQSLGGYGALGRPFGGPGRLSDEDEIALAQILMVAWRLPDLEGASGSSGRSELGAVLAVEPAGGGQPASLYVKPFGAATVSLSSLGWTGTLNMNAGVDALVFRSTGVTLPPALNGAFGANLRLERPATGRALGSARGTRFEPGALTLGAEVNVAPAKQSYAVSLDIARAALILSGGDGDGFLAKVLPRDGIVAPLDLGLAYSNTTGFTFKGATGLNATFDIKRDLAGILRIDSLWFSIDATAENGPPDLSASAALTGGITIGPIAATIDRAGIRVTATFPPGGGNAGPMQLDVGFRPPRRISLKIAAGPVKGSGFLSFEPAQYSGALQLSVKAIGLTAVGVINTRFTDGRTGYSMVIIITADFPSIPLPFGFALNGVGGIVGIHRRMDLEAIKQRVAEGALASILFPRDPIARMNSVLADISAIFPVQEGRHVFGPMVRLTWGPAALLTIEVAVLLDIPTPLRLAILGRMRLVLPDPEKAVADIRLDVAGLLDFGQQTAVIAASLVDSRIAGFTITGDMAMVLSWGPTKAFSLSMGGFYPGFPVPQGMPARMRRLAISLGAGDNPRFQLESYFAVTANTVQFGAKAELFASTDTAIGNLAVIGQVSFDAFLQFDPFQLEVMLRAYLGILRNGTPLLSAELEAKLSGPDPWHLVGFAAFEVVVKWRIPFELSIGQAKPAARTEVDVQALLAAEVARPESWASVPPPEAGEIVALRQLDGAIILHPLGGLAMIQRLLPFDKVINRFGPGFPKGNPPLFHLSGFRLDGLEMAHAPRQSDFAPGQFDNLKEDQKLCCPDFEAMNAGGAVLPPPPITSANNRNWTEVYEEFVLSEAAPPVAAAITLLQPVRFARDEALGDGLIPSEPGITLHPERFVLANAATLEADWPLILSSRAEAADSLAALPAAERLERVIANAADCWVMP